MNVFLATGRLVRDAELRYTRDGQPVLSARIAVDRGMSREQREAAQHSGQPTADFFDVVLFGKAAEAVVPYLTKGKLVAVSGSVRIRPWQGQDGQTRVSVEVRVRQLQLLGSPRPQATEEEVNGAQALDAEAEAADVPF